MDKFIIFFEKHPQPEPQEVIGVFKTKTAAKWLESVKKKTFVGILTKSSSRVFKKQTPSVPVSLPFETTREQKIQRLEKERRMAQALEHVRRNQIR